MLDRNSRDALNIIKSSMHDGHVLIGDIQFPPNALSSEFFRSANHLADIGLLTPMRSSDGKLIGYALPYRQRHRFVFSLNSFGRYVLQHWIDILALAIAVAAFLRTL